MEVKTIKIKTRKPYGVVISNGAIEYLPYSLADAKKVLVVSDDNVYARYFGIVKKTLSNTTAEIYTFVIKQGENGKSKAELDKLLILMTELNLLSTDAVIALGGGTVSDLAGFASAVYKRGIPCINIPTTLLSMCDAAVGGKSAINFLGRKNLLGVIRQPKAVFCDTDFIKTLPSEQKSSGFAEIIKCAIIGDKKAFDKIEAHELTFEDAVFTALTVKGNVLKKDEYDENVRHVLNLGHTFGHAYESVSGFTLSHGEGVAYGLITALDLAEKLKIAQKGLKERIESVLKSYGLFVKISVNKEKIFNFVLSDKKRVKDKIELVLIKKIGKTVIKRIPVSKLKELYLGC